MNERDLYALAAKLLKHYATEDEAVAKIVETAPIIRGEAKVAPVITADERALLNMLGGPMAEAMEARHISLASQGCGCGCGCGCGDGDGDGGEGGSDAGGGNEGGTGGNDSGNDAGGSFGGSSDADGGKGGEGNDAGAGGASDSGMGGNEAGAGDADSGKGSESGNEAGAGANAGAGDADSGKGGNESGNEAGGAPDAGGDDPANDSSWAGLLGNEAQNALSAALGPSASGQFGISGVVGANETTGWAGNLSGNNLGGQQAAGQQSASENTGWTGDLSGVNSGMFGSAFGNLSGVNAADMALGPAASGQFGLSGVVGSNQEAQEMGLNIAGILGPASTPAAEQQVASNPYGELNVAQIAQDFNLNPNAPQYTELTINKSFSPTAMSSTSFEPETAMSSTSFGPPTAMSSTSFGPDADPSYSLDNALGGLGGDGSSAVVPSGLSSLSVATQGQGGPTSAPQFAPAAAITPTTPKEIGRAFSLPELNYLLYGYGPESSFFKPAAAQGGYFDADAYFADGGLVATSAPPAQPTVASYPTMAYTDGQGPVGAIAAPPAMPASDLFGSDAPHASPMAPAPAAAAPTLTPDSPFLATQNVNATPVPAPISQNPNLGYSLGLPPLSGLKG
jgi:hypothetical protein